jgi:hypothetical protein
MISGYKQHMDYYYGEAGYYYRGSWVGGWGYASGGRFYNSGVVNYGSWGYSSGGSSSGNVAGPVFSHYYNEGSGQYVNRYTGETMSTSEFFQNTPYLTSPEYVDYSPGAVAKVLTGSREVELLSGTDPLGSRMAIFTYPDGTVSGGPVPFWEITGSYYNELYYFSGLVAFDTYAALNSGDISTNPGKDISYWDFIRNTDFPDPIIGMPPALGKAGGVKVIKSLRGIKLSDYIRTGKTLVPNQLVKGPGTPGATVTWGIKGGGKNMGFHYHIHRYNWYKPWIWFKQTPIIKPPK